MDKRENRIFTIGHSTRSVEEIIKILKFYNIEALVDVRRFPGSRRNPQVNKENLDIELEKSGVQYYWIEGLGGFREGGYEKYMGSEDFEEGLKKLIEIARQNRTTIMCAEILWFKCHRSSIASALTNTGWEVIHIYDENRTQIHKLRG